MSPVTVDQKLNNKNITIDWKYLSSGRGVRRVENVLQVVFGRILLLLVAVFEIAIVVSEFSKGFGVQRILEVEDVSGLLFWFFLFLFLYSLYLLRDRSIFLDKPRYNNLAKLRKAIVSGDPSGSIEITNYLSHEVLWIIDYVLNISNSNYLGELFRKLAKLSKAKNLISRLGTTVADFDLSILENKSGDFAKVEALKNILLESFSFALENKLKYINEEVLTFFMLKKYFSEHLLKFNVLKSDFEGIRLWLANEATKRRYVEEWKGRVSIKPKSTVNRAYTSRFTPTLNEFSRDFTNAVVQGEFKISIAREKELNKLVNTLEKGKKSAVLVVGEPGVGKTTLLKSLAVRMVVEDVPRKLQDKRLVGFNFNKAFTASKSPDEFKKKLRKVFEEAAQSNNVVLVLDNINQLLNLRQEVAGEIVNLLVDAFDSYNIRIIATTDRSQYSRFIRPHRALAGMFTEVTMSVPSDEVSTQIIIDEVPEIEKEYNVKISYSAVKASIELSHKFAHDRVLPDKAIDILKETVVNFKNLSGQKPIEYDEVAKVVSSKVGVKLGSISEDESSKLARLEEAMHKRVIDQNPAIKAVCSALRRSRSGLSRQGKPISSFLFFGPTGVGKTEVAKTVADVYYGSEQRMVRIDMTEYNEEENLERLIGFTSQQGSFEGGFLTEPVHQNPFSVVLLDEIDKANVKVLDLFFQVLDEGSLTDGLGRRVDFSNTIIIATSNAGSQTIASLIESGQPYEQVQIRALEELKKIFRIEFLNRFDKIIMFKPLSREEVKLVAKKFLEQVRLKLLDKGIKLVYTDELLETLAQKGYNPVFGAREMRRVVTEEVENKVADLIVRGEVKAGEEVRV